MKRRRISRFIDRGTTNHILVNYSGPSFADLPSDIVVNILFRVSIKGISTCKCVCKAWYSLISGPEFAKLYQDQAQVCPLIYTSNSRSLSETLYLVQPDKNDFELKLDMCDHAYSNSGCVCNIKFKLDTKFTLPSCNLLFDDKDSGYNMHEVDLDSRAMKSEYRIVNSCNGLLCFFDPAGNRPLTVCNPVTGEFINLPKPKKASDWCWKYIEYYGFVFSAATNQYKVLRIIVNGMPRKDITVAEVHIVGTESWKDSGIVGTESWKDISKEIRFRYRFIGECPVCLSGFIYWCYGGHVISFDVDNDRFASISGPTKKEFYSYDRVGVLEGELCISMVCTNAINVWAMKVYGAQKTWSQVLSIDTSSCKTLKQLFGPVHLIKYLNHGSLLLFYPYNKALVYIDPKNSGFRQLKVRAMKSKDSKLTVIPDYTPSFVSLKHALSKHDVKVLNFKLSYAESKLQRQAEDLYIFEE